MGSRYHEAGSAVQGLYKRLVKTPKCKAAGVPRLHMLHGAGISLCMERLWLPWQRGQLAQRSPGRHRNRLVTSQLMDGQRLAWESTAWFGARCCQGPSPTVRVQTIRFLLPGAFPGTA